MICLLLAGTELSRRLLIRWKCHVAVQPRKPQHRLTVCFFRWCQWLNLCCLRLNGKSVRDTGSSWSLQIKEVCSLSQLIKTLHTQVVHILSRSWAAFTVCHSSNCKPRHDVHRRHRWQAQMLFGLILSCCLVSVCVGTWGANTLNTTRPET